MRNHLKLLSTSLIVTLSFASSQASYGMDNNDEKNNRPTIVKTRESSEDHLSKLPRFLKKKILDMAIYQQAVDEGKSPGNIEATCKNFQNIIATDTEAFNKKEKFALNTRLTFLEGLKVYYNIKTQKQIEVFDKFYNSKLVYKPNPNSDNGKIELLISGLKHPLKGRFDLSKCDDTGTYLSINMGYRKGKNQDNADKVEIWFAPRFLIEAELGTTAAHFKPIMDDWKQEQAPVGMFCTCGGWDNLDLYEYLTTKSMDYISELNIYKNWERCSSRARQQHDLHSNLREMRWRWREACANFQVLFVN